MMQKLFFSGLTLFVSGLIGRLYAAQYTYVAADGILHDTIWLPIGTILLLFSILALLLAGVQYLRIRQQLQHK